MSSDESTKSPIKNRPLRSPGASLVEAKQTILSEEIGPAIAIAVLPWFFVLYQLVAWIFSIPPGRSLGFVTFTAVLWSIAGMLLAIKHGRRLRNQELGLQGELTVAEFLEDLRKAGYQVFHSVPGENFDVDHVVVGPGGIFVIETKTWRKPAKGPSEIRYDGKILWKNGKPVGREPIDQVLRNTDWIVRELERRCRKRFPARPILAFPGWYVKSDARNDDVWVLNPKGVPSFIQREPEAMSPDEVHLAVTHLEQYIRNTPST